MRALGLLSALLGTVSDGSVGSPPARPSAPTPNHHPTTPTTPTPTTGWVQDRFVISFWVDPIVPAAQFAERYAEVAAANFTVVVDTYGATTTADLKAMIATADAHGLAVIGRACKPDSKQPSFHWPECVELQAPNLMGYFLVDEPAAGLDHGRKDFGSVLNWSSQVRAHSPGALAMSNLLGNYAPPSYLNAPTYGDYISQYIEAVRPQLLCVDHYPFFEGHHPAWANASEAGFRENMAVLRDASIQNGIPFWVIFHVSAATVGCDCCATLTRAAANRRSRSRVTRTPPRPNSGGWP